MEINLSEIPKGKEFSDYPKETVFVFEDKRKRKIDSETGLLIKVNE